MHELRPMLGEKTVHVTVKRRDAATVAGDGDRADKTVGAGFAEGARAAWAPPVLQRGKKAEPMSAFLAADESGRKIAVRDVNAAQRL